MREKKEKEKKEEKKEHVIVTAKKGTEHREQPMKPCRQSIIIPQCSGYHDKAIYQSGLSYRTRTKYGGKRSVSPLHGQNMEEKEYGRILIPDVAQLLRQRFLGKNHRRS